MVGRAGGDGDSSDDDPALSVQHLLLEHVRPGPHDVSEHALQVPDAQSRDLHSPRFEHESPLRLSVVGSAPPVLMSVEAFH